ncbi:MAG: lanthionine synthetase LanC family protein [Planctomycetota bacterium]|jgi:lantibiotic modifying enzyme
MTPTASLILAMISATGQTTTTTPPRPALEAALAAARWLASVRVETDAGTAWPVAPDLSPEVQRNLYSGTPGVILLHLELARATGDATHLATARAGGDDLLAAVRTRLDEDDEISFGLWTGAAGQAHVLLDLADATGNAAYRDGARALVDLMKARDGDDGGNVRDIIGGWAGTGLLLIEASRRLEDPGALDTAVALGRRLLTTSIAVTLEDGSGGRRWRMHDTYERLMPNFSHGTAGICYFLVMLARELDGHDAAFRDRLLQAAVEGGRFLLSIAERDGDGCLIRHHEPGGEELFYLGWCHGPVGTSRLFAALAKVTGDASWSAWPRRGATSIARSGIPEEHTPGFWNNVGVCCGAAGVGCFFLDLHATGARDEDRLFANSLFEHILDDATVVTLPDGATGMKWVHAEHRVRPEEVAAQTGFMQGAAGIGLALLKLDAQQTGRRFGTRLPDGGL